MTSPSNPKPEIIEQIDLLNIEKFEPVALTRASKEDFVGEERDVIKEKAAYKIAKIMTSSYMILLAIPFLLLFGAWVNPTESADLIKTMGAVLGGPVGAVIGYYFGTQT